VTTHSSGTLYIPAGSLSKYQAIEGWTKFSQIVEGYPKAATVDGLNYTYLDGGDVAYVTGRADEELRNITIPSTITVGGVIYNVKGVKEGALQSCSLDTLVISEGIEIIENYAFAYNYNSLKSITLPSSLRTIGDNAFYYCYGFKNLIIPEGVETIGSYAFGECRALTRIELPSTLKSIADYAFWSIDNLTTVISRIQTPFEISGSVFAMSSNEVWNSETEKYEYTYTPSAATLCVPDGTKSAYEAIEGWTMFANIYEGEPIEAKIDSLNYLLIKGSNVATVLTGDYGDFVSVTIPTSVYYQ
jgi:hypothetical protein